MVTPPSSPPHPPKKPKTSSPSPAASDDEGAEQPPEPGQQQQKEGRRARYKRRKVAIFLGYCGAGYQGMQKNPGARTIEGDLEEVLFLSGAVPAPDRGLPRRYDWARAARTDKGVSAVAQVVSGRFYVDPPGLVARLNARLPTQIRVFGYKRVTNSFNAKKFCDRRRYVYLLPVFALDPNAHPDRETVIASVGTGNELARCLECSERGRKVAGLVGRQSKASKQDKECDPAQPIDTRTDANEENQDESKSSNQEIQLEGKSALECKASTDGAKTEPLPANCPTGEDGNKENREQGEAENGSNELNRIDQEFQMEDKSLQLLLKSKASTEEEKTEKTAPFILSCTNGEQSRVRGSEFRYGEEERERFSAILKRYVGTHNFHNFTTRTKAEDPSARRYIISFVADRVVSIEGMDFIRCEVVGQSFMLHQIRKMIGLAVAIMRNCAPESLMDAALKKDVNINVPTAPEVGLYLDECLFTSYNQKWKDSHEELSMEAYAEEAEEFKMKHIYSHIASMELKEGAVALWLHSLNHRNYPDFRFMETNGDCVSAEQIQVEGLST